MIRGRESRKTCPRRRYRGGEKYIVVLAKAKGLDLNFQGI
jgi:hypothetical protein